MHGVTRVGMGHFHFLKLSAGVTTDRYLIATLREHARPPPVILPGMKRLHLCLAAVCLLTSSLVSRSNAAEAAFDQDRRAILGMSGEFEVEFFFQETLALQPGYQVTAKPYTEEANETVKVAEDSGTRIVLQHILQVDDMVVKHWSQVWTYQADSILEFQGQSKWLKKSLPTSGAGGTWTQRVTEVTDAPRYEARGTWVHHPDSSEWTSQLTNRPLPRREYTTRSDYDLLQVTNRHTVTAAGWSHEQDNTKWVRREGKDFPLCREIGMNRYQRTKDADFAKADKYWEKTASFWGQVRTAWDEAVLANPQITLLPKVNDRSLYQEMLAFTHRAERGKPATDKEIRNLIAPYLAAAPAPHQP